MPNRTPAAAGSTKVCSGIKIRPVRRKRSSPTGVASPDTCNTSSVSLAVPCHPQVSIASQMPSPSASMPVQPAEQHMS
jgi:hypothetical protein